MEVPGLHRTDELHPKARCCWCGGKFRKYTHRQGESWLCDNQICATEQLKYTVAVQNDGELTILYVPLPRQVEFHRATQRRVLIGGAAGGSKSHSLRWDSYMRCLSVPNYRALILRRTFPELEKTHMDRAAMEAPLLGAKYSKTDKEVVFPNGSKVVFGHCQDDEALGKHLSTEWDDVKFDELVTFTERQYLMISSRGRTSKGRKIKPRVGAGTNPGGPGATWVKQRFIDHEVDLTQFPSYKPEDYAFIPSRLHDNPYIDEGYEESLRDLPAALRRAYLDGDWEVWEGQYFSEWSRSRHVGIVGIPDGCQWVRAVDWGYSKNGWCGWFACLPDGRVYLAWEYVFRQTIAAEVAKEIKRRTGELLRGGRVRYTVGDTAMWTPDGQTGESIAETFARNGVPMVQADKERINGWQRLRAWLRDAPDGKPWMMVHPDCAYAIRTIPSLVMDAHKPEDVDTDGDDHAADAIRYFVMSRPSPTVDRRPAQVNGLSLGYLKKRVKKHPYAA